MGCDIHAVIEKRTPEGWQMIDLPLSLGRWYAAFAWLAGVRNYSAISPISLPRGVPDDFKNKDYDDWREDVHSASWLHADELSLVDYDEIIEDRRCAMQTGSRSWDGRMTCEAGQGRQKTLRDFLGSEWMGDIQKIIDAGDVRFVFWFDN